jgi:hypothetical protein
MFFEEYINLKFFLLKSLWSYNCSKFWKSYTSTAARIRVDQVWIRHFDYVYFLSPILHAAWLDSHALTLKNYTAKYYEVRKI